MIKTTTYKGTVAEVIAKTAIASKATKPLTTVTPRGATCIATKGFATNIAIALLAILALLSIVSLTTSASASATTSKPHHSDTTSVQQSCNTLRVAMLQGFYPNSGLTGQIQARPGVGMVDGFDTYANTPTLAQLQPYDLVVIVGSGNYADRVAMGNVLADYVDGGGVVVQSAFENVTFSYLQGRWLSGEYSPIMENVAGFTQTDYLGVYSTTHPLMQGIGAGSLVAQNKVQATLTNGATEVARYNLNSTVSMVAYKGRVVALNAFLSWDGAHAGWSGPWGTVAVNAANWIYNCPPPDPSTTTPIPTSTATRTATATITGTPPTSTPTVTGTPPTTTPTPVPCSVSYTDVSLGDTFYPYITCLSCNGVLGGYPDGTFRPGNNVTRGQLSKIVANAAGFIEPAVGQTYTDVPVGSTFYDYIERLSSRGIISGYPCGGQPGEPCDTENRPYFRTGSNATRGQISKIISNAATFSEDPGSQIFTDVAPGSAFYSFINRLAMRNIISGYDCGGPGEPCDDQNRPYFRPGANATRGQTSKLVANTFYPECAGATDSGNGKP